MSKKLMVLVFEHYVLSIRVVSQGVNLFGKRVNE